MILRNSLLLLFLILQSETILAIQTDKNWRDYKKDRREQIKDDQKATWMFFEEFEDDKEIQKLIHMHWVQFFTDDIIDDLSKVKPFDYYPLFFDSYGGLYPRINFIKKFKPGELKSYFESGDYNDKDLREYSWYQIFFKYEFSEEVLKNTMYSRFSSFTFDNYDNNNITAFYKIWDSLHLNIAVKEIEQKLTTQKKNVVFFVHGYNVPYSLAAMQAKVMMDSLDKIGLHRDSTLLIPIFWSSNDQKNLNIQSEKSFTTKNIQSPKNLSRFQFYSNRAYYTALSMRVLLNKLSDSLSSRKIFMIAHSLGATIPTTIFIDTKFKLDTGDASSQNLISEDIKNLMDSIPIPKLKISIFLSAPAIPGINTFREMDPEIFKNIKVFSCVNPNDEMTSKKKFFLKRASVGTSAGILSSTTLGPNARGEVEIIEFMFNCHNLAENFTSKTVSIRFDHDIFTYLRQEAYVDFLEKFIKSNP